MRTALLRGRDHLEIGALEVVAEGAAALALSRGGAPKNYAYTSPNEDAVAFALGPAGSLVAVADGHNGHEASELALRLLVDGPALPWTSDGGVDARSWPRHARASFLDANRGMLAARGDAASGARTTLSMALVLHAPRLLLTASMGDCHVFRVGRGTVQDLARDHAAERYFLGHQEEDEKSLEAKMRIEARPLGGTRALVLASDGLSEKGIGVADPAAEVRAVVDRCESRPEAVRALETARGVAEVAMSAQREQAAGDNASAAVLWIQSEEAPAER